MRSSEKQSGSIDLGCGTKNEVSQEYNMGEMTKRKTQRLNVDYESEKKSG